MNTKKAILVVEDDRPINEILTQFLTDEGYKVLSADSTLEALRIMKAIACNLILLDFTLPDANANTFLDMLPENAQTIPIIGISATPEKFKYRPQLKAVLAKPFDIFQLEKLVAEYSN